MVDKVRIKKYQQSKVKQWSEALEVPETRFIEDAVNFYLRHLDGKLQLDNPTKIPIILEPTINTLIVPEDDDIEDDDNLENFTGGIEL
ncbi:MAG: hypothetical protein HC836_31140 [Richelia sp. RM2_1_2]|nr:hypothetical protein [Richelia sp. RM2_1_2]